MTNRRGLSSIEVLVALALIALCLYPVIVHERNARDRALSASCLSNLKQIGLSCAMYATDYDNRLPLYDNGSDPRFITDPWGQATRGNYPLISDEHPCDVAKMGAMAYTKNTCIMQCPADPHNIRNLSNTWNELFAGCRQDKILAPARKIVMIDQCSVEDFTFVRPTITVAPDYDGAWATLAEPGNFVHMHGLNCLYVDGHAKWLSHDLWPLGGPITPGNQQSAFLINSTP